MASPSESIGALNLPARHGLPDLRTEAENTKSKKRAATTPAGPDGRLSGSETSSVVMVLSCILLPGLSLELRQEAARQAAKSEEDMSGKKRSCRGSCGCFRHFASVVRIMAPPFGPSHVLGTLGS